jgi:UDP-N-acetylmuramate: L-alanyl-gamma-D-glutamyl-meso-diaminopimelate ligase
MQKRVHIIGICGVATSALAIAFHKKGWKVSGSDKGFYPPVSTALEQAGIPFYAGWHPEKMISPEMGGVPDFVVAGGGGTSASNPELMYARENKIEVLAFAEALGKFFIKKNSIVTVGTWGKTTTSAILSYILLQAGMKPSYFTGGISLSHDTGELSDSDWSVVEGDEYQTAIWDKKPKFAYYAPTHLLLTSVSWDHADLYPTEETYFNEFKNLVGTIPPAGLIVSCADDAGIKKVIDAAKCKVVTYGKDGDYSYHNVFPTKKGIFFKIDKKTTGETFSIESPMLGRFNVENIAGCFAMTSEIGIEPAKIIAAIAGFKGIKRRLEKRFEGEVTLLDCHAPTAEKAQSILESIREVYDKKIIAVYEPNIGGRQRESIAKYNDAFAKADLVVIPRLTKLKIAEPGTPEIEKQLEGSELAEYISKTHKNVVYIEDDKTVVTNIVAEAKPGDVIAFLGSHGFRGMIEETVSKLK